MKCPNCGLTNPPSAQLCDCGYSFESADRGTKDAPVNASAGDFSGRFYWFDLGSLKRDLKSARYFSSRSIFIYVLTEAVLISISSAAGSLPHEASGFDPVQILCALISIAITFWGVRHVYDLNGGDSGIDFLPRLLTLAWVWGWRFALLVTFPFLFVLALVVHWLGLPQYLVTLGGVGIFPYYYLVLANLIKEVRQAREAVLVISK